MKIVINSNYGGFWLSKAALDMLKDKPITDSKGKIIRHHPDLVAVVEQLGQAASRQGSNLTVVELPDNIYYCIDQYRGWENITWSKSELHHAG